MRAFISASWTLGNGYQTVSDDQHMLCSFCKWTEPEGKHSSDAETVM